VPAPASPLWAAVQPVADMEKGGPAQGRPDNTPEGSLLQPGDIPCDYCGQAAAVWYVSTSVPAPLEVRSRLVCDRHLASAKAVVGDQGRPVTVTPLR